MLVLENCHGNREAKTKEENKLIFTVMSCDGEDL